MSFGRGTLLAGADTGPAGRDARTLRLGLAQMFRGLAVAPGAAALAVSTGLINAACMVLGAKAVGWATEHVVVPSFARGQFLAGSAAIGALFILGVSLVRVVTIVLRAVGTGIVQFGNEARARRAVVDAYLRLGISWHRRHPAGALVSRGVLDTETAWDPMQHFPFALGMTAMLLMVLGNIALVDGPLAVITAILMPLVFGANLVYQRVLTPRARGAQRRRAVVSGLAHEALAGRQVVRTLGITEHEIDRFATAADESRVANRRMGDAGAMFDPIIELLPPLAALLVLAVGVARVDDGHLGVGALVEVIYLLITTAIPLNVIARFLGVLPLGVAGTGRVEEILTATEHPAHGAHRPAAGTGGVRLIADEVGFRYRIDDALAAERDALREIALDLEPGAIIAVAGTTGSGKSTLLALLAHLLEPDRGRITLDGEDTRDLAPDAVRRRTALVTQQPFLFADTVRANVTLGAEGTAADLDRALRIAGADGFVARLADGPDTPLDETSQLSGGQRQRIALARAIFRRPGLLLLDDATSALDPLVERTVVDALREEYAGDDRRTTVVLVGHRAATVALADTVILLAGGRIVARGTHTELLDTVPEYRALLGAYADDTTGPPSFAPTDASAGREDSVTR